MLLLLYPVCMWYFICCTRKDSTYGSQIVWLKTIYVFKIFLIYHNFLRIYSVEPQRQPFHLMVLNKRSFFNLSCFLILDKTARSSANSRSSNVSLNLHQIPVFTSTFHITQSMTSKKRNPDITQPCQSIFPSPSNTSHWLVLYIAYAIWIILS